MSKKNHRRDKSFSNGIDTDQSQQPLSQQGDNSSNVNEASAAEVAEFMKKQDQGNTGSAVLPKGD